MSLLSEIVEQMDSRADKLLRKAQKTKNKKLKKQLKGNADAIICEYYEWFDSYFNDLPYPNVCGIRKLK